MPDRDVITNNINALSFIPNFLIIGANHVRIAERHMNSKHLLLFSLISLFLGLGSLQGQIYFEKRPEDVNRISICAGSKITLFEKPGQGSKVIGNIFYTEELRHLGQEALVKDERINYIEVESTDGRIGWVDDRQLVRDGGIVVLLQDVSVFNKPSTYSTATGLTFYAGELLILSDWEDNWVFLTGENKRVFGWGEGYERLSVDPIDIEIAGKMRRALMINDPQARKIALQDIGETRGFMGTPMREIVKNTLNRLFYSENPNAEGSDYLTYSGSLDNLNGANDPNQGGNAATDPGQRGQDTGENAAYLVETVVNPQTNLSFQRVRERGSIAAVKAKNPKSIYYVYHKTLPVGSSLLLEIPSAPGNYVTLEVVASLKDTNPHMIGLGAEVIKKVFGVATAKEAGDATIYYPKP